MMTTRHTHLPPWPTQLEDRQQNRKSDNQLTSNKLTPSDLVIQHSLTSVQKHIDDLTEATLRHMHLSSIASGNGLTFYLSSGAAPPSRSLLLPGDAGDVARHSLPGKRVNDVGSHSRYLIDMRYPAFPAQQKHENAVAAESKLIAHSSTTGHTAVTSSADDQSQASRPDHVTSSVRHEEHYMKLLNNIISQAVPLDLCIPSPTKLLDFLYIGGYKDAEDVAKLRRLGITHVFNCAPQRNRSPGAGQCPYPPNCGILAYDQVDAADDESYDMLQHFDKASQFIDRAKFGEGRCLVHCAMGINRSGAICVAYIIADQRMKLLDAVRLMKQRRGTVLYNRGFQRLLIRFARQRGLL